MANSDLRTLLKPAFALLTVGAVALSLPLSGCAPDPQQVEIERGTQTSEGLTPLQRGEIRREALDAAKKGMDAWLKNDVAGMRPYWAKSYVDHYTKVNAENARKGLVRVRKLDNVDTYDVTDMSESGNEVIVDIYFDDGGYFKDAKGTVVSKPSHKATQIQLTLAKQKGTWTIIRMIAGDAVLK